MFYLGGSAGRCNIELHDIQFVAAHRPEDAWPQLKEAWFGDKDKVHLDGYLPVTWADGYDVSLCRTEAHDGTSRSRPVPSSSTSPLVTPSVSTPGDGTALHLYFVYAGGYRADALAEQHDFGLFVAPDAASARQRAMQQLLPDFTLQHKDSLKDVDSCLLLDAFDGWRVKLTPNPKGRPDQPAWQGYQPL